MKLLRSALDLGIAALLALPLARAAPQADRPPRPERVQVQAPAIPSSIDAEHQQLHARLAKVLGAGGRTAEAARGVETLLRPHFVREEQFALPPLGALAGLAAGQTPADPVAIIAMSDRLKAELPQMLREHQDIGAALSRLRAAAREENKREAAAFAEALLAHAQQEEQILYPSAILVGAYLKLKR